MEHLPQTKGKGVLMFAQRRQRMDELSAEQEEMRRKGIPVDAVFEPEGETVKSPPLEEAQAPQDIYLRQQQQYQDHPFQQQMLPQSANGLNGLDSYQGSTVSRSLVSNRTAKPFLGGHNQGRKTFSPVSSVSSPTSKKPENIFKVPVPVNTTPQVWSPTSDIIASRDERIAIPAIKTGILPEAKRRGVKSDSKEMPLLQKKGDQKSLTESFPEEDFFSLGAEACNFMQAPKIKQKNPPPVLPKPAINLAHPPWSAERRPMNQSPLAPAMGNTLVQAVPQQNPPKQSPEKAWFPLSSQPIPQEPPPAWVPDLPQPSWTQRTPDSLRAGPSQSKTSRVRSSDRNSVASCPPQHLSTCFQGSKAPSSSPKGYSSDAGASEGLNLKGKGAELFARRQSRMEKFVVDDETVRANKPRPSSPTFSMPSTWKYSSNVRAPPPVSYNPILSPFYPLAAVKQPPPATSPKIKSKANKEKKNPQPKHLNVLDVMKHQPYQLNSSLFTYNSTPEAKEAPTESKQTSAQTPTSFQSLAYEPSTAFSPSPNSLQSVKQNPSKGTGEAFSKSRSWTSPQRLSSVSPASPVSTPGVYSTRQSLNRQYSWVEQPQETLSSVDEVPQSLFGPDESKISATPRKSLPQTPAEWRKRLFYEAVGGPQEMEPVTAVTSPTNSFSSVPKEAVSGPPFRPAQPLVTSGRYSRGTSLPTNFTLHSNCPQLHRVSWKL
ncbi:synaptopodin-2 [Puntigrus tetrazona]|uniref:synaptopodin-2 n=1 Tax=Puntigrus tetrazona TaxID=1606681 RepID=UPI001C8A546A|nr:synaptopodin-2 [Puntigrus tetrazona]XP_043111360.1 synaptopodin-2 [Puntigrus tetrazona]XP_043112142.1 synaptopodin-2 [Puntigrus tetrazona]